MGKQNQRQKGVSHLLRPNRLLSVLQTPVRHWRLGTDMRPQAQWASRRLDLKCLVESSQAKIVFRNVTVLNVRSHWSPATTESHATPPLVLLTMSPDVSYSCASRLVSCLASCAASSPSHGEHGQARPPLGLPSSPAQPTPQASACVHPGISSTGDRGTKVTVPGNSLYTGNQWFIPDFHQE